MPVAPSLPDRRNYRLLCKAATPVRAVTGTRAAETSHQMIGDPLSPLDLLSARPSRMSPSTYVRAPGTSTSIPFTSSLAKMAGSFRARQVSESGSLLRGRARPTLVTALGLC